MGIAISGVLAFIMFGMGMGLKQADFARVLRLPKAVGVGLACQILLLPLVALALVQLFPVGEALVIGLMIIALTPGGAVSNLWTHIARGDIALSVTLTALSGMLAVFIMPLLLNLFLRYQFGDQSDVRLPVGSTMAQIALVTVVPVSLGMVIHAHFEAFTMRVARMVRYLSILVLIMAVGSVWIVERANVPEMLRTAGLPILIYNFTVMTLGYLAARLARLPAKQVITIAIEVGIQNVILSATVAVAPQFLGRSDVGLLTGVYGLTMGLFALGFIGLIKWAPRILGNVEQPVAEPVG